jgi:hypothetical protein
LVVGDVELHEEGQVLDLKQAIAEEGELVVRQREGLEIDELGVVAR